MARKSVVKGSNEPGMEVEDGAEGVDEGYEENDACRASFMIHDGIKEMKVQALVGCWALQRWSEAKEGGKNKSEWKSFKYYTDLGSVASKIYEMRLKNAEVTTLEELSKASKQIAIDVRREFSL